MFDDGQIDPKIDANLQSEEGSHGYTLSPLDEVSPMDHRSPELSEAEADRYFERQEMLHQFALLFDYSEASDRAIAIVGPAFLDSLLSNILREFMVENDKEVSRFLEPEGALGSYGSRISACYCLGLVGPMITADLRLVGKIRNRFAHDIRATFGDPKIQNWCQQLAWHKQSVGPPPSEAPERDLFQVGVNQLVAHLNGLPGVVRLSKRHLTSK